MVVKDILFQRVRKSYGYEVESSLRGLEEYDMEGEIPTIIMIIDTDPSTRDANNRGLYMLYQVYIPDYINISL